MTHTSNPWRLLCPADCIVSQLLHRPTQLLRSTTQEKCLCLPGCSHTSCWSAMLTAAAGGLLPHKGLSLHAVMCGGAHLSGLIPMVWMPQLPYAGELSLAACCADALGGAAGIGTRRTCTVKPRSLRLGVRYSSLSACFASHAGLYRPSTCLTRSCTALREKGVFGMGGSIASPSAWSCSATAACCTLCQ